MVCYDKKFYLIKLSYCYCYFNSYSILHEVGAQKVFDEYFKKMLPFFENNAVQMIYVYFKKLRNTDKPEENPTIVPSPRDNHC